ncbi:MAG: chromosomal replication initiator protein DnaA [bacterium]
MDKPREIPEEIEKNWQECIKVVEKRVGTPIREAGGLRNSRPIGYSSDTLTIGVASKFGRDFLSKHYSDLILSTFEAISGKRLKLNYAVAPDVSSFKPDPASNEEIPERQYGKKEEKSENLLNPHYTFDTFVVGNSNQLAVAAAIAVAEHPAKAYNPLFIYGGVGLGKTHLIHAIGNSILAKNRKARVVYASMETFTNEVVESIKEQNTGHFRKKYRYVDALLIDDVQFLVNKERTKEEFFHTFNELHGANKQIVITSDKPPSEIHPLEERLRSRFEWGLTADIQAPDIETRQAILLKKAEQENFALPLEVVSLIAEKIPSNIRELEGALNRVVAFASLYKRDISLSLAAEALQGILKIEKSPPTILDIQKKVAGYYNITHEDLIGEKRDQRFVVPRQIAMYLAREISSASYPDIGRHFGGKDHTTALYACKKIARKTDEPNIKKSLEIIQQLLKTL